MKHTLVVTGPSGVGKTYLAQQLLKIYPNEFEEVKIFTTRDPRSSEKVADRVFISHDSFAEKHKRGDFFIAEKFYNHYYGYEKDSLKPTNRNLIVNAWPALIPRLRTLDNICVIGLSMSPNNIKFLQERMARRGDSSEKIKGRLPFIEQDLADLEQVKDIIEAYGKLFEITDDTTLESRVIPWIKEKIRLGLG